MNLSNYLNFGMCVYNSHVTGKDDYKLGDVIINKDTNDIGVIIQVHEPSEFRCDAFGNFCSDEVRLATDEEIAKYRPNVKNEASFFNH